MGMTVFKVLGATTGRVVSWGSSLGQEFEQVVMDVTIQEGPERPEGWEGGGGEVLDLGNLGWSGVCWVTRE